MQIKNRITAIVLVLLMLASMLPLSSFAVSAATANAAISMEETWAAAGSNVDVKINIKGNPGIIGGTLTVSWPEGVTLVGDKNGDAFSSITYQKPSRYISTGTNFVWYGSDVDEVKDGTVLVLTFKVDKNVTDSDKFLISVDGKNFIDSDQNTVKTSFESGYIRVVNYTPGDVSGDGNIAPLDLVLLARYISDGCVTDPEGYNVTLKEAAADVNDDGELTPMDLILISRYISDGCKTDPNGYNITLKPSTPKCQHSMTAIPAVNASCTENGNIAYWYCTVCEKYFSDENGKTEVEQSDTVLSATHKLTHVNAKAASYIEKGNIEHWYCSVCKKYFADSSAKTELFEKDVFIDKLVRNESTVVYNVYGSDPYLESIGVDNTKNKSTFYSDEGLVLNDIVAPAGYIFNGWTTASGMAISEIEPSSSSRQIVLNANWSKVEYTVTFDSPDVPVNSVKYTVDTGTTFENASWYGYTFVGWSNNNGFLVKDIKPGTTGNMTLHANWTSNRNKATSYSDYGEPISIIEDDNTGRFLFVYNIGKIDNVPLSQIEYIGNSQKINIKKSYQVTNSITETEAETVAEMISKATTESSGWTLSKDWNKLYEAGSEYDETRGKTQERTDSQGNVTGGNYYVSNSQGGASFVSTNSGGSSSSSSKVTTDASVGIHGNYKTSTETNASVSLGIKNETELSAGVKYGPASAGVKNTTTVSAETNASRNDKESFELDSQKSYAIGTVDEKHSNSYYDVSVQNSSNWNTTSGYEKSYQSSQSTAVSNAISEQISEKTTLNVSEAVGGEVANSTLSTDTSGKTNEYSTAFGYSKGTGEVTTKDIEFSSDRPGYYRLVTAGTVHVFGVVGYDVATDSYFTYTYSVLDDERHSYLDYSKDDPNFKDCQNAVVPFEVPYYPHEYIMAVTGRSEGLQVNLDGYITGYTGNDTTVVIPQYWQADNGDGTYTAIKICGIADNYTDNNGKTVSVFGGNTNIEKIVLPKYITKIPNSAFEGCTSLETVFASGVTEIGENAFKGCSSLAVFTLDEYVTKLGHNAFDGVSEIVVMASNSDVFDAAVDSGAKRISLNLSKFNGIFENKTIKVTGNTEYFALISNGTAYKNMQIDSKAKETFLSNFSMVENKDTPLKLNSEKVTLNRITVQDAPGFALILTDENTEIKLYGDNTLNSTGNNTILSKNTTLSLQNSAIAGRLVVDGNLLCCGAVDGTALLKISNGAIVSVTTEEFEQYLSSIIVSFDSNGGSEVTAENRVYYGQSYGQLPVPTRANHGFVGWFTDKNGGTQVTGDSIVSVHANQKLYAHWEPNQFTLTYDANGGNCSVAAKSLTFGDAYGSLPTPTRTHYTFDGWYTSAKGGEKVTASTAPTTATDMTIYAHWTLVPYTISWNNGTGYFVIVKRTSSPNANASLGELSSENTVYYGDVISVEYIASTGYSIVTKGIVSTTVVGNITSSDIYATVSLNNYTYNIIYRSSNGTSLGSTTVTYKYGTTNTISAPSKSGYNTPSSQSIKWDSTSAKTITFTYTPSSVSTSQKVKSGTWWHYNGAARLTYSVNAEYRNRTVSSVQIRFVWTNTMNAYYYYGYTQSFNASANGVGTGDVVIASSGAFNSSSNSARSKTAYSDWITVPVSTDRQDISLSAKYWDSNGSGTWNSSITIPAY